MFVKRLVVIICLLTVFAGSVETISGAEQRYTYTENSDGLNSFEFKNVIVSTIGKASVSLNTTALTKNTLNIQVLPDEFYYYRNALTEVQKKVYDEFYVGVCNATERINFTKYVTNEEIEKIIESVMFDHPEIFWCDVTYSVGMTASGSVVCVWPEYNDLVSNRAEILSKIDEELAHTLDILNTLDSDADIVKYVHDYLVYTLEYKLNSAYNQTIYSAIINKESVCAGYAKTFQYIMQKMGIPCAYVTGITYDQTGSDYHAWNVVKIDNEYYEMDVTWDDPLWRDHAGNIVYRYIKYIYTYFGLTSKEMSEDHQRADISKAVPDATGTKYSYNNYFGGNAEGTDFEAKGLSVPSITAEACANAVELQWGEVEAADGYAVYLYQGGKYYSVGATSKQSYIVYNLEEDTSYTFAVRAFKYQGYQVKFSGKYRQVTTATYGECYVAIPSDANEPAMYGIEPIIDIEAMEDETVEVTTTVENETIKNDQEEVTTVETKKPENNVEETTTAKQEVVPMTTNTTTPAGEDVIVVYKPNKVKINKVTAKKRRLTIKWAKADKNVVGFEVQVGTNKNFVRAKTYNLTKTQQTTGTLKQGKKYYVRVRCYYVVYGRIIYSDWSAVKQKKIK